ncbi:MAG: low molecular weight protein-tyrosine-phosphatase [Planctomycetota bacterium]
MAENLQAKRSVLFVCMGNICRSPAAEGIFRKLVDDAGLSDELHIDSAGTIGHHAGNPPDRRMQAAAAQRGYDLTTQRARQVESEDFRAFDLIVAMDRANLDDLERAFDRPADGRAALALLGEFAPDAFQRKGGPPDVPDPYYGGGEGFEMVLDLLEASLPQVLQRLRTMSP